MYAGWLALERESSPDYSITAAPNPHPHAAGEQRHQGRGLQRASRDIESILSCFTTKSQITKMEAPEIWVVQL
jgi:hypothetical protein